MEFDYLISDREIHTSINIKDNIYEIKIGDNILKIEKIHSASNLFIFKMNGINHKIFITQDNGIHYIFIDGQQYRIEDLSQTAQKSITKDHLIMDDETEICAPMPGKILKIFVAENDHVQAKQNLVIVEAMKMENNIVSPIEGTVKRINFKEGDLIDTGQPIIELEPFDK